MPQISDVYQITFLGSLFGQQTRTVRHVLIEAIAGPNSSSDLGVQNAIATQADALYAAKYRACLSADGNLDGIHVKKLWPLPQSVGTIVTTNSGGGTLGAGGAVPSNVAGVVWFKTDNAGRRYRGRMFLPAVPVAELNGNQLSPLYNTRANTLITAMIPPFTVTDTGTSYTLRPIIYHRNDHTGTYIRTGGVNPFARSQRRRETGKGV